MALDGFWSDFSVEPKRKFRWLLSFRGVPQWILKKVTKPSITITEAEHTFVNYKFYYPGRVEWSEITMTLADPVNPDASATMMQLLKDSGYVLPHNFLTDDRSPGKVLTISKQRAVESVGGALYIQQIDADGNPLEEWKLHNPWLKAVSFDELDYESEDINNLELTFRYDWASLTDVGGAPGRVDVTAARPSGILGR